MRFKFLSYSVVLILFLIPRLELYSITKIPIDAEEGYFTLIYSNYQTEITTFSLNGKNYLPLLNTFFFLKIYNEAENNNQLIKGFFIERDSLFNIDFQKMELIMNDRKYAMDSLDFLLDKTEVYVSEEYLKKYFSIEAKFNILSLKINLLSELELPLLLESKREKNYKFIKDGDDNNNYPLIYKRKFRIIDGGIMSYDLSYRRNETQFSNGTYNLNLGMSLLNGAFNMQSGGHYNFKTSQNIMDNYYSLKYLFQNKYLSQLSFGHVNYSSMRNMSGASMSMSDYQLMGVLISNETPQFHSDKFSDLKFRDYLGENWQVELYLNGRLFKAQRTGGDGYYNFDVPINYGTSDVEMKFYGPAGQFYEKRRNFNIINSFLPPGTIKYSIWGGQAVSTQNYYSNADINFGLTSWLTSAIRLKYDFDKQEYDYMGQIGVNLFQNLIFTSAFHPEQGISTAFNLNSKGGSFNLNYTNPLKFNDTIPANKYGSTGLYFSFNKKILIPLSIYTNLSHTPLIKEQAFNLSTSLSSNINSINLQCRYRGNFSIGDTTTRPVNHSLEFSASYYIKGLYKYFSFIDYSRFQINGTYDIISKNIRFNSAGLSTTIFKYFNFNFGISQDYSSKKILANAGITFNTPYFRSNSSIDYSNNDIGNISQQIQGITAFDPQSISLNFSSNNTYNSMYGNSGAKIRFFKDVNNNNKLDEKESIIEDIKINLENNKTGGIQSKKGTILINNLVPNYRYNVSVDEKSIKDPVWTPKYKIFSFISDANSYKIIDIPCVSSGIFEGTVLKNVDGKLEPQNRIRIHIADSTDSFHETVPVFTDGTYYKMGIIPGEYKVYIDSLQLHLLNLKSEPNSHKIIVKNAENGDYIADINFLLTPNNVVNDYNTSLIVANNGYQVEQIEYGNDEKAGIILGDEVPIHSDSQNVELKQPFSIQFSTKNSTVIDFTMMTTLDSVAAYLNRNISINVEITGHTCTLGSITSESDISTTRVETVKNYLISKGINSHRIKYEGKGSLFPIYENNSEVGKLKNSRVEIKFINN